LDDSKKILYLVIPGGFILFMLLMSLLTGANPIESFFLLIGQILMYMGGLLVFGLPVFMLFAFAKMAWNEEKNDTEDVQDLEVEPRAKKRRAPPPKPKQQPREAPQSKPKESARK